MCMNGKQSSDISVGDLDKVCFVLVNAYKDTDDDLGISPLNDGYLVALNHYCLGFKVCIRIRISQLFRIFLSKTLQLH